MNKVIFILFLLLPSCVFGQSTLKGKVLRADNNEPVFGASVYLKNNPTAGTATNLQGRFVLAVPKKSRSDTLIISSIGYNKKMVPLSSIQWNKLNVFYLKRKVSSLNKLTVSADATLAKEFSTVTINRIEIYMTPTAGADPLKAITMLPASTNTDESANPELRGSKGSYSRVILNGAPLYYPVRNSSLDGLGNFSILSTEMIDHETVYAGNPPLKYGNAIAGLIEVRTRSKIKNQQLKVAASLAGASVLYETPISDNSQFIQIFGNYEFSNVYSALNQNSTPYLKEFGSQDIGLNFHDALTDKLSVNTYSYFINESYRVKNFLYNYSGEMNYNKKRYFNIFNLRYVTKNMVIRFVNEFNTSHSDYTFGNIRSQTEVTQVYNALNMQYFLPGRFSLEMGMSDNYFNDKFTNTLPTRYFAVFPNDPTFSYQHRETNHNLEAYLYGRYNSDDLVIGVGLRKNIPIKDQPGYLSYQGSIRYNFLSHSSVHLSAGKYNGYTTPHFRIQQFDHVSATQFAIGYRYKSDKSTYSIALYKKRERLPLYFSQYGVSSNVAPTKTITIKGVAVSAKHKWKHFVLFGSYTWLSSKFKQGDRWFGKANNLNYFVKLGLSYYSLKYLNVSLTYITRPGLYYTPIVGGKPVHTVSGYRPIYGTFNSRQLNRYSRFDFEVTKIIDFKGVRIIPFILLSNVLNRYNQASPIYSRDYSHIAKYQYYQKRGIYFGVQVTF